jgi:hypothetical protein
MGLPRLRRPWFSMEVIRSRRAFIRAEALNQ